VNEPLTERWQVLCGLALKERNPQKFFALIDEIKRLLKEMERLLDIARHIPQNY